jgi:Restriction endonuclease
MGEAKRRRDRKLRPDEAYEELVAAIMREFEPNATVTRGAPVKGPDETIVIDVLIDGKVDGHQRRIVIIECKDYNPKTSGRVKRTVIDGLDSVQRDLKADLAIACSNAGFQSSAVAKARRLGIPLVAVLRQGDQRVRYEVVDDIYYRRIKVARFETRLQTERGPVVIPDGEVLFQGLSVPSWAAGSLYNALASTAVVNGDWTESHTLASPQDFQVGDTTYRANALVTVFRIEGGWFRLGVKVDSTSGFYSWLRRRVSMPKLEGSSLSFGPIDFEGGTPIRTPPDHVLNPAPLGRGEVDLKFLKIAGSPIPVKIPALEKLIEQLDHGRLTGITADNAVSSPSFMKQRRRPGRGPR